MGGNFQTSIIKMVFTQMRCHPLLGRLRKDYKLIKNVRINDQD